MLDRCVRVAHPSDPTPTKSLICREMTFKRATHDNVSGPHHDNFLGVNS
jgi:hypothetical protein